MIQTPCWVKFGMKKKVIVFCFFFFQSFIYSNLTHNNFKIAFIKACQYTEQDWQTRAYAINISFLFQNCTILKDLVSLSG